jgi:prophage regulatory protein
MNEHLPRVITRRELRRLVPYTPQHILRLEKKGQFPQRIKFGEGRVRWWLHEVMAWREQKGRKGSGTVAARIRKHLVQVLTFILVKLRALRIIPARKS